MAPAPGRLVPPPRITPAAQATARWTVTRCPACREHRASLVACTALPAQAEVTVAVQPCLLGLHWDDAPWGLSFDGSARQGPRTRGAGAAAVLWAPDPVHGQFRIVAAVTVALPGGCDPLTAEAWGCFMGLAALRALSVGDRRVDIWGDNPQVIQYGAEAGRLRNPTAVQLLGPALSAVAAAGWRCRWRAVPRRHNQDADRLARAAAAAATDRIVPLAAATFGLGADASSLPAAFPAELAALLAPQGPVAVRPLYAG